MCKWSRSWSHNMEIRRERLSARSKSQFCIANSWAAVPRRTRTPMGVRAPFDLQLRASAWFRSNRCVEYSPFDLPRWGCGPLQRASARAGWSRRPSVLGASVSRAHLAPDFPSSLVVPDLVAVKECSREPGRYLGHGPITWRSGPRGARSDYWRTISTTACRHSGGQSGPFGRWTSYKGFTWRTATVLSPFNTRIVRVVS